MEVDVLLDDAAARDDIAVLFGELSRFHETYGVYADPVDASTGRLPAGWVDRLVPATVEDPLRSRTYTAWCAEPHDLCVAKLIAGRAKDRVLVSSLLAASRVQIAVLEDRVAACAVDGSELDRYRERLRARVAST